MAYITKDEVKAKTVKLKEVAKKYGCKIRVSGSNSSTLKVNVYESKVDPTEDAVYGAARADGRTLFTEEEYRKEAKERFQKGWDINVYWVDTNYTGKTKEFVNELLAIMKEDWYDHSDAMTDYFSTAWYNKITFGTWEKPCVLVK